MMITETAVRTGTPAAPAYAVLGRFADNRTNSRCFEAAWDGRAVTVVCTGTRENGRTFTANPLASPEDDRLARAWAAGALAQRMIAQAVKRASEPHPGRVVRSTVTRGKNKGLTGTVRQVRVNFYNTRRTAYELVVDLHGRDEQRVWEADRAELIDADAPVYRDQITRQAAHLAATSSWASLTRLIGLRDD